MEVIKVAKDTEVYVCPHPSKVDPKYTDNQQGKCACGADISFRPYAPTYMRKICYDCANFEAFLKTLEGEEIKIETWHRPH